MFTVLIITVTIDLLLAFGVGMIIASFLFMPCITDMQIEHMRPITKATDGIFLSNDENEILLNTDN